MSANVVQLRDHQEPKQRSMYDLYPLPFFNGETRSTWDVSPTGDYGADCEKGRTYAIEFLKTCDGSLGWSTLLSHIVSCMVGAGCTRWPDGHPKTNGIVIGFVGTIGKYLACR
jgi:hypothetical protein